jgi:hypothetical protein
MLSHYQYLVHNVRPISISPSDTVVGPRIGGNAPEGIVPPKTYSSTHYFVTIDLDEEDTQEVSLFTSLDYDEAGERSLYRNVSRVFSSEDFVQIITHPRGKRSDSANLASELPGRALEIKPPVSDIIVQPGSELLLPNKIGGRPYFYYGTRSYIDSLNSLFDQGFVLFLQLTWGGYEKGVPSLWPFDEYTFHLLAKETPVGISWRFGWG